VSPSWINFFVPLKGETPCLGIAFGRKAFWAARIHGVDGSAKVEDCQRVPLEAEMFSGAPSEKAVSGLALKLSALFKKVENPYLELQVALPDPAVRFEVFELEKLPRQGAPLRNFLAWRLKEGHKESNFTFASQVLGEEEGKILLLGMAVEEGWLSALKKAFRDAGVQASVIDMALSHRFNFFQRYMGEKGQGKALVAFEPEYWSITLLDKEGRPRFLRSKWWNEEMLKPEKPLLKETVVEVERTIRSYVYSAKNRNVEALYVTAPDDWLVPAVEAFNEVAAQGCVGLNLSGRLPFAPGSSAGAASPAAVAAAVKR
jgi:hypothetical protein